MTLLFFLLVFLAPPFFHSGSIRLDPVQTGFEPVLIKNGKATTPEK